MPQTLQPPRPSDLLAARGIHHPKYPGAGKLSNIQALKFFAISRASPVSLRWTANKPVPEFPTNSAYLFTAPRYSL